MAAYLKVPLTIAIISLIVYSHYMVMVLGNEDLPIILGITCFFKLKPFILLNLLDIHFVRFYAKERRTTFLHMFHPLTLKDQFPPVFIKNLRNRAPAL